MHLVHLFSHWSHCKPRNLGQDGNTEKFPVWLTGRQVYSCCGRPCVWCKPEVMAQLLACCASPKFCKLSGTSWAVRLGWRHKSVSRSVPVSFSKPHQCSAFPYGTESNRCWKWLHALQNPSFRRTGEGETSQPEVWVYTHQPLYWVHLSSTGFGPLLPSEIP